MACAPITRFFCCCDVEKRSLKYNFLNNQLTKFNLVGVVEGHSDNTKVEVFKAASRLMPMVSFWEHGKDSGSGGLGLLIQEAFSRSFNILLGMSFPPYNVVALR